MAETTQERKARLEAELRAIEAEDREALIAARAAETTLAEVISHLVEHSAGYPTHGDREAHARAVRRHFQPGEQAHGQLPDGALTDLSQVAQ